MGPDPVKDIIWEGFEGRYGTDDERGRMPTLPPLYYERNLFSHPV